MSDDTEDSNVAPLGITPKPTDKRGLRVIRYTPGGGVYVVYKPIVLV